MNKKKISDDESEKENLDNSERLFGWMKEEMTPIGDELSTFFAREQRDQSSRVWKQLEDTQSHIDRRLRQQLINWMMKVALECDFSVETIMLAVAIFDRYLQSQQLASANEALSLAVCSLHLASKFEEEALAFSDYVTIANQRVSAPQLQQMEQDVWQTLSYQLSLVTPHHFLTLFCRSSPLHSLEQAWMLSYLLRLSTLYLSSFLPFCPSLIAASVLYLCLQWYHLDWSAALQEKTSYQLADLSACVAALRQALKLEAAHPCDLSLHFASEEFGHVSSLILAHYQESCQ